ncbi:MAG: DUF2281 domain-containing protein [Candidatus Poribacteria bacterium]|nr:DUF2281 domain-containing protein [Candidatus Poribacteria bacterium]
MSTDWSMLERKIRELPPDLQREVEAFVDNLTNRREGGKHRFAKQDWGGALSHLRDQYTSLELQKKALEWREG